MDDREDRTVDSFLRRYYLLIGVLCIPITFWYWYHFIPRKEIEMSFGGVVGAIAGAVALFAVINFFVYLAILAFYMIIIWAREFNEKVEKVGQIRILVGWLIFVGGAIVAISFVVGLGFLIHFVFEIIGNSSISDNKLLTILMSVGVSVLIIGLIIRFGEKLIDWIIDRMSRKKFLE
ncbi:MAG: hypothetical protein IH851_02940 [Armatimonadetes bacterium]|nr:hypothetical protein [Armatimonadota bacterium]